ncbi:hypothetical protein [Pseudorhodobacter sp.]|nr:hypothetical protein [Pseudorhodobacter sp.]MDN5788782.1 hypothetical protein [Pseudorhodobacter sp.]
MSRPAVSYTAQGLIKKGLLHPERLHHCVPYIYRIEYDAADLLGQTIR